MRILELKMLEKDIRLSVGEDCEHWKISHKDGNNYSSFGCDLGPNRKFFISNTIRMQEVLEKPTSDGYNIFKDYEKMQLVPLYRNCLMDYDENFEKKKYETMVFRVETTVDDLANVILKDCYAITAFMTDGGKGNPMKVVAFGISVPKDKLNTFTVEIIRCDGMTVIFKGDNISIEYKELKGHKLIPVNRINTLRLLMIPRKTLITNDIKVRKEGYITVHIFDVLSKNSKIVESRAKEVDYLISDKLSLDHINQAAALLSHPVKKVAIK